MRYFKGRNALIQDLEWDTDVDSDYEDDSAGVGDGTLKAKRAGGADRVVLVIGSFSACAFSSHSRVERTDEFSSWKSLFFYRCTDVISFAPLKSQGIDSRSAHIRKVTGAIAPPPCSPKSIYVLASSVRCPPVTSRPGTDILNRAWNSTPLR